jgi:hypothetical protein
MVSMRISVRLGRVAERAYRSGRKEERGGGRIDVNHPVLSGATGVVDCTIAV